MSESRVAARYARSIFDLAVEQNVLDKVMDDAQSFLGYCHSSRQFALMLRSPIVHKTSKRHVMEKIFGDKFQKITMTFINIVLRKNREIVLKEIFEQFSELYNETKGIVTATVYTVLPVSDALKEEINNFLKKQTKKEVELHTSIAPELVGGFILRYEDKLIDASVSTQLKSLRQHLIHNN
jgi:F-type H+-transporting ATPase subunit delta